VLVRTSRGAGRQNGCSLLPVSLPHAASGHRVHPLDLPPGRCHTRHAGRQVDQPCRAASGVVPGMVRSRTVTSWPALTCRVAMGLPFRRGHQGDRRRGRSHPGRELLFAQAAGNPLARREAARV